MKRMREAAAPVARRLGPTGVAWSRCCVTMSPERCSARQGNMVTQQRDHATQRSTLNTHGQFCPRATSTKEEDEA